MTWLKWLGPGALLVVLLLAGPAWKGAALEDIPAAPDPAARYLFYLHGAWVEMHGRRAYSDRYGVHYEDDRAIAALSGRGFTVISEVRRGNIRRMSPARTSQANNITSVA